MPAGCTIPRASIAAVLIVGSGVGLAHVAAAATSHKPRHTPPAPTVREVEPETTATIPSEPATRPPATAAKADNEQLPPPFHLPNASRARMRDCGLKWQAMKVSGEAGDDIWRDYATRCLAATNGPLDKR